MDIYVALALEFPAISNDSHKSSLCYHYASSETFDPNSYLYEKEIVACVVAIWFCAY